MNHVKYRCLLLAFLITPFFSFATSYYINDAALSGDVYTTAIGNDANSGTAAAPFATLAFALSVATDGDIIYIDAGTYPNGATVTINKAVNIYGPNAALSGYSGSRTAAAVLDFSTNPITNLTDISVAVPTAAIEIKGITLYDDASSTGTAFNRNGITVETGSAFNHLIQNNVFERNNTNLNTATKNSLLFAIYLYPATAITIDNNYFHGLSASGLFNNSSWRSGIWANPNNAAAIISNNRFVNMRAGMNVNINPALVISGNDFQLGVSGATGIASGGAGAGMAYTLAANNFAGYGIFISLANGYSSGFVMDATANTYNGNTFSSLNQADALAVEASFKHGNMSGLNGFIKIKPGNVYVTPAANGDNAKFIQKTIDNFAQPGDVVNIGTFDGTAGAFAENVVVNKAVTLAGQGQATVTLYPAISNPNCTGGGSGSLCSGGTAASNVILVQANNVTVKNMTIDGNNPALTSGQVFGGADIDARNGIITDHSGGMVYNGLTVDSVTIRNIFLRGIYASTGGSFTFSNNTISNVQADPASIAVFNYGGAGTFLNNTVSSAGDAIASNWSKGSTYSGNTVTSSGSGIHTDNNGGMGGTADLIQNNTINNGPAGSYGIFVFAPFTAPTVNGNTITNVETGLASFGQNSAVTPIFTANVIDAQNKANSTGIAQTTDQLGFGSNNVAGSYSNNYILNNTTGIAVTYQAGYTNNITVNNNYITGNTTGVKVTTGGTLTDNFDCNWWGASSQAAVLAAVSAPVTFTKWLSTGTDYLPATGFQPVPGACDQVLPIIFTTELNGARQGNSNTLQWVTAAGSMVLHFELQRSNGAANFTTIAVIDPVAGNRYSYRDNTAVSNTPDYYRLKITELSGQVTYSRTIVLGAVNNGRTTIKPSPFTNTLTILPAAKFSGKLSIALYNMLGELVSATVIADHHSNEVVTLPNLGSLPAGVYRILLQDANNREASSIIK